MNFYSNDTMRAVDAIDLANRIAFAPVVFQASRALKRLGILQAIEDTHNAGLTAAALEKATGLSRYGVRVLCEAGLAIGLLYIQGETYYLTKAAHFFMHDELTVANTDFINDVCYKGLFHLEDAITHGKPEGLKELGSWNTIYEGLSQLPPGVQDSWFKFDHYYSDVSFGAALPIVFAGRPKRILDIGGNTGKFAFQCLAYDADVEVTIMDLPGQLNMAKKNAEEKGWSQRLSFVEANVLDRTQVVPGGYDVIWLSQFLDCFSDEEIVSILQRCNAALRHEASIFILEPFWDRQRFQTSAFCLMMTSLYFTAMANGNSQMYKSDVFLSLIEQAGLHTLSVTDGIGVSHSLVQCAKFAHTTPTTDILR